MTRGDPPLHGDYGCGDGYSTEELVSYIRRNEVKIKVGVVTSMRYPVEKMVERVKSVSPDFTAVIRFSKVDLQKLIDFRSKKGER